MYVGVHLPTLYSPLLWNFENNTSAALGTFDKIPVIKRSLCARSTYLYTKFNRIRSIIEVLTRRHAHGTFGQNPPTCTMSKVDGTVDSTSSLTHGNSTQLCYGYGRLCNKNVLLSTVHTLGEILRCTF